MITTYEQSLRLKCLEMVDSSTDRTAEAEKLFEYVVGKKRDDLVRGLFEATIGAVRNHSDFGSAELATFSIEKDIRKIFEDAGFPIPSPLLGDLAV